MHGLDTVEIFRVHDMLAAGPAPHLGVEIIAHGVEDGIEDMNVRHHQAAAAVFQMPAQIFMNQGIKHHPGLLVNDAEQLIDLFRGAHHAPHMLLRLDAVELRQAGARDHGHGFPRAVRNKMQMEFLHGRENSGTRAV